MAIPAIVAGSALALAVPLVVKVLVALGIGFVTYTGADFALTEGQTWLNTQVGSLPSNMYNVLMLMGLDEGMKILFAAFAVNISIKATVGAFTRVKIGGA